MRATSPGARILHQGMTNRHDETVRELLQERAVWELKRVRLADDMPIAIEHAYYPPDIGLELEKRDLTSIIMYRVFESDLGLDIKEASQTISATRADAFSAELLGVEVGSPLLSMQRLTTSRRRTAPGAAPLRLSAGLLPVHHQPDAPARFGCPGNRLTRTTRKVHDERG